ncbi:ABC-type multidrug transport system permease subunit [Bacillus pakistanensis]|uniref:ABC-type multidrug transport system permease subunit n=1 Tax=Rossellomorea pakistanensis TaxID=992288 RepID=A0ABS2NF12_9BACI|nr:tryptophan transporter [Bacillus pakistanensis]MBM7586432.1 ABC-type multidrug transport system permease subunit [Bacillus pakistanensis]
MNTKTLVALSLLVGIGAALHAVIPGIFLGMKPDMMLTMMFLGIVLFPDKKNVLLLGFVTGIISGITTQFPGGFIPNLIDKPLTAFAFYGIFLLTKKMNKSVLGTAVLTAAGTIISGVIFLASAYFIVGLPGAFVGLFVAVVLPATVVNTGAMFIVYPIVQSILKRTSFQKNISQSA